MMQVFSAFRQQNLRRWYFPILIFRRKPCMHLPVLTRKRKAIRGAPSKRMTWSATTIQLLNRTSRRFWRMQTGQNAPGVLPFNRHSHRLPFQPRADRAGPARRRISVCLEPCHVSNRTWSSERRAAPARKIKPALAARRPICYD